MKHDFEIGDRVETVQQLDFYTTRVPVGSQGKVVAFNFTENPLVEFDKHINGHGGVHNEQGKNGHCWWIWPGNLRKVEVVPTEEEREYIQLIEETCADVLNAGMRTCPKCRELFCARWDGEYFCPECKPKEKRSTGGTCMPKLIIPAFRR